MRKELTIGNEKIIIEFKKVTEKMVYYSSLNEEQKKNVRKSLLVKEITLHGFIEVGETKREIKYLSHCSRTSKDYVNKKAEEYIKTIKNLGLGV